LLAALQQCVCYVRGSRVAIATAAAAHICSESCAGRCQMAHVSVCMLHSHVLPMSLLS
jgi:hypothetical protein